MPRVSAARQVGKVLVLGDAGCGKTALVNWFCKDSTGDKDVAKITLSDGQDVSMRFVEIPFANRQGDNVSDELERQYRTADFFVVVYDVNSETSLDDVPDAIQEVSMFGGKRAGCKSFIVLANKQDLVTGQSFGKDSLRELLGVSEETPDKEWMDEEGIAGMYQTCALTGQGLAQVTDDLKKGLEQAQRAQRAQSPMSAASSEYHEQSMWAANDNDEHYRLQRADVRRDPDRDEMRCFNCVLM